MGSEEPHPDMVVVIYRVYVSGELVRKDDVTYCEAETDVSKRLGDEHKAIADAADRDGKLWLLEIEMVGRPIEERHIRFGTDAGGMVDPQRTTSAEQIVRLLTERAGG